MDKMDIAAQIEAGTFDGDLLKIQDAVTKRIEAVRASRKFEDFSIGARVRFNEQTGTRYMVGEYARIVSKRQKKLVVQLENPVGRFARHTPAGVVSTDIVVPLAIVDLV